MGAQVADAERAAGDCVHDRDVGAAVVGEDPLNGDAVAGEEGERSAEEADCGCGLLVGEDLGVGEAAVVVDGDVDVVPACGAAVVAVRVAAARSAWPAGRKPTRLPAAWKRPSFLTSMWTSSPGRERS